jgi:hypothetical protein
MSFVQRDCDGLIVGSFANLQPGFAEEYVSDDDPELLFASLCESCPGGSR